MKKYFEYLRPVTIEEAVEMKAQHGSRAKFWAGGTDLALQWKRGMLDIDFIIDLTQVPSLRFVEQDGSILRIGSMAKLDDIDKKSDLNPAAKALGETARLMCTKQTRTIATVGGNMCHASPSADLSPPLIAMGTQVKITGPKGERTVALSEFHTGVNQTVVSDDELVTEFFIADVSENMAASYKRVARTVVDIALVSSAVCIRIDDKENIVETGVALGAVAPSVISVPEAENALNGKSLNEAANGLASTAGQHALSASKAISDIRASKEYRAEMVAVLTERAVHGCIKNLRGA